MAATQSPAAVGSPVVVSGMVAEVDDWGGGVSVLVEVPATCVVFDLPPDAAVSAGQQLAVAGRAAIEWLGPRSRRYLILDDAEVVR